MAPKKPPIPRDEPPSLAPPRPRAPAVSYTPIGVKRVSLTGLEVEVELLAKRVDALEAQAKDTTAHKALEQRVRELEEQRHSVVTRSEYPTIAKQHADTTAMEKIVERRKTWRGFWRAVAQALLIAALLALGGLIWSYWVGPKPQNPPIKDPADER